MRSYAAAVLILSTSCLSAVDPTGPALEGPGGAKLFLPVGESMPAGARLVLSSGAEPPLPRDLIARSSSFTIEPPGVLDRLELRISIPADSPLAELYVSEGDGWSRVSSTISSGTLRATVRSASHLIVANTRTMAWHEVRAPRGGLSSFVFSDHRIFAMSSAQGAVVSDDEGETWRPLDARQPAPQQKAASLSRHEGDHHASPGPLERSGELYVLGGGGGRLYSALSDGSVRYSDDGGATWHDYSGGLPAESGPPLLASDGSRLFASIGGRTFKARAP